MLVLPLKAAESFLETSREHNTCIYEHNSVEVQKNPDDEMWQKQILSSIGKDPD